MNLRKSSETKPLSNHAIMTSIRYIAELLANAQLYIEVTMVAFKSGTLFVQTNITSVSRLYIDDRSQLKVHTDVLSLRNTFTTCARIKTLLSHLFHLIDARRYRASSQQHL